MVQITTGLSCYWRGTEIILYQENQPSYAVMQEWTFPVTEQNLTCMQKYARSLAISLETEQWYAFHQLDF